MKVLVYASKDLIRYIEPYLGKRFFVNNYYKSMGLDFYRKKIEKKMPTIGYVEINYYFWILNPDLNFDHIRADYEAGARGAIVLLDMTSEEFTYQLRKVLEEFFKINQEKMPIVFLFKVKHEMLNELDEEKTLQLVQIEADILISHGVLVGFYFFSEKNTRPIKEALKNLLYLISRKIIPTDTKEDKI